MTETTRPAELHDVDPARILDLDVRRDLRAGKDPFQRIMHGKNALADDGILRLRAIFEPRPLYAVLGQEGFAHWTEQLGPDDWSIWFYRVQTAASPEPSPHGPSSSPSAAPWRPSADRALPTCGTPRPVPVDVAVIDVRGMEPPEPMTATLGRLEHLPEGHTLVQVNQRVPHFLLPELERRGFQYAVREEGDEVRVFIRRREEHPVLDVRFLPPKEKHPTIFTTFDALAPGEAFVIVNDHDPIPLKYQFQAERPGAFAWAYEAEGPELWRVRIGRTA